MKNEKKFKIYRLCRDQDTIKRFELEGEKYNLPDSILVTGPDYFTFIEDIIKNCKEDYALLCHDDVVVPLDIQKRVIDCIEKADNFCGENNWGIVGNAGIEAISLKTLRFLKDPHSAVIPFRSNPVPVVSVDGNVTLLNLKNIRKNKFELPKEVRGFHFYDFITLVECYRKNLLALVDSSLYVYHRSGGVQKGFDEFAKGEKFQKYWSDRFVNHKIYTINGPVKINKPRLEYLKESTIDKRSDFYSLVKKTILLSEPKCSKPIINVVTRTQLRSIGSLMRMIESFQIAKISNSSYVEMKLIVAINNLKIKNPNKITEEIKEKFHDLEINFVKESKIGNCKPRVQAIKDAINIVTNETNNFIWVVDDDDFIFPKEIRLIAHYLDDDTIFIGNSEPFDEEWEDGAQYPKKTNAKPEFFSESLYSKNYIGDNHVPICSVIFPTKILKNIFDKYELLGDYYEDYALLFLAQIDHNIQYLPLLIAGVSHHNKNTIFIKDRTHWDYSYATFLTEIVNSGVVTNSQYELVSLLENYEKNYRSLRHLLSLAFNKAKYILSLVFRLKIRTVINIIRNRI